MADVVRVRAVRRRVQDVDHSWFEDVLIYVPVAWGDEVYLPSESFERLGGEEIDGDAYVLGGVEVSPDVVELDGVEVCAWRVEAGRLVMR